MYCNIDISRIEVLNLTHFSHFLMDVTLLNLLFGLPYQILLDIKTCRKLFHRQSVT